MTSALVSLFGFTVSLWRGFLSVAPERKQLHSLLLTIKLPTETLALFLCWSQSGKDLCERFNAVVKFQRISKAVSYPQVLEGILVLALSGKPG